jgi:Hemerythrin HHE cation binding domain.
MNIDKFKQQHVEIISCISALRAFAKSGIQGNATEIAKLIVSMSATIRLHLAVEDKVLYPALQRANSPSLASMAKKFQDEMKGIASAYLAFAGRWNTTTAISQKPEDFRSDANGILKILHDRMHRENVDFYPAIEAYKDLSATPS